ncbi:MAG: Nramp family divalent metal transporter [Planctomycetota bacterium]|jgi:NRAMP (natural resistance-associated macrophage protein)-like metal ion transporter
MKRRRRLGPGFIVAAAFIGPGTVTTASQAGASYGTALAWALVFAVIATIVLQEMSARLGIVTQNGLGESLRNMTDNRLLSGLVVFLVIAAIAFGNAAFEMGNITGAAIGLETLTNWSSSAWALVVGSSACLALALGANRRVERLLIALVIIMSVVFVVTAVLVGVDAKSLFSDLFIPRMPAGSLLTVIALIGTTVVPYNLFLHASTAAETWKDPASTDEAIRESRWDTGLSVLIGGGVTLAIVITAAACFPMGTRLSSAGQIAQQLEPLMGRSAQVFFAVGLFAAGLTSAITAPLAAAYAAAGALGWSVDYRSTRFRLVWLIIVIVGTALSMMGYKPVKAIVLAQAANGLLLPLVAVFLLVAVNRSQLLGKFVNGWASNVAGTVVVVAAGSLGVMKLMEARY